MKSRSFKQYLIEARKNSDHPEQKKLTHAQIFKDYANLPEREIKNLYVSFTDIDKLGINPASNFDTPLGIYTYPLSYVLSHNSPSDLPFAGSKPFVWVIKSATDVLDLRKYDNLNDDKRKAFKYLIQHGFDKRDAVALINEAIKGSRHITENQDASRMWNIARLIARDISRKKDVGRTLITRFGKESLPDDTLQFNYVLRKAFGYNAVLDTGLGIVHPNEPVQCVFLTKNAIEIQDKLINRPHAKNAELFSKITPNISNPDKIIFKLDDNYGYFDLSNVDIKDTNITTHDSIEMITFDKYGNESVISTKSIRQMIYLCSNSVVNIYRNAEKIKLLKLLDNKDIIKMIEHSIYSVLYERGRYNENPVDIEKIGSLMSFAYMVRDNLEPLYRDFIEYCIDSTKFRELVKELYLKNVKK